MKIHSKSNLFRKLRVRALLYRLNFEDPVSDNSQQTRYATAPDPPEHVRTSLSKSARFRVAGNAETRCWLEVRI